MPVGSYGCTGQPPAVRGISDLVVAAAEGGGTIVAVVAVVAAQVVAATSVTDVATSVTDMAGSWARYAAAGVDPAWQRAAHSGCRDPSESFLQGLTDLGGLKVDPRKHRFS